MTSNRNVKGTKVSVDLTADVIDVRDIIEEYKEVRESGDPADRDRADALGEILGELAGYGGDEQFEGDWYPITLVRDSYFVQYAMDFAEDIGAVNPDATWPNNYIDWDRAADALQMDYSSVEINGTTYWY